MCAVTERVDNRPQLRDTLHEVYAGDSEHAQLCHGYDTIVLRRCALRRSVFLSFAQNAACCMTIPRLKRLWLCLT